MAVAWAYLRRSEVTVLYACDIALLGDIRLTATDLKLAGVNLRNAKTGGDQCALIKHPQVLKLRKDFAAWGSGPPDSLALGTDYET